MNLGGQEDIESDTLISITNRDGFGTLSFGNVARSGLTEEFVMADFTVAGSRIGGGGLGKVSIVVD